MPNLTMPIDPTCRFCDERAMVQAFRGPYTTVYWCGTCGALYQIQYAQGRYREDGPCEPPSFVESWKLPLRPFPVGHKPDRQP